KKSTPAKKTTAVKRTPAKKTTAAESPEPTPAAPVKAPAAAPAATAGAIPARLLTNARTIAASHRHEHGEDIKPNQLAVRLRVPTPQAADILTHLRDNPPTAATTRPHNGSTVEPSTVGAIA
ncbi:hypothetical protein AB0M20_41730, partial [Actinoplanes sp. NPDC051633]